MFSNSEPTLEEIEEYNFVVNQTFRTEEEFFKFYNDYAKEKGFSVRKGDVRRWTDTGEIKWRRYLCSNEGFRSEEFFERTARIRTPWDLTRCECPAKLKIKTTARGRMWYVNDFVDIHDHPFMDPQHVGVLWSHRGLNEAQKAEAIALSLGGLRPYQVLEVMQKSQGGAGADGILSRDMYNFIAKEKKRRVQQSDAEYVLNYMSARKDENPEFYFEYTRDDEMRLQNIFWSDSQSQIDFNVFGDVVVFDSTYRVNRYNLPFVPFIGVGHHRTTVMFGCAILLDEIVPSYVWLLKALLKAMRQHHPRSLITDGDHAMARAIEVVMPWADHRLCSWHIEQNLVKWYRGEKAEAFKKFIYSPMEVDEWEIQWVKFKATYKISKRDVWFSTMYELKWKWSAAHTKGRHFLGMQSNQRSESLNSRLHNSIERTMSLIDLVEHYEACLFCIRRWEVELDGFSFKGVRFIDISADPLEKHAARIFTREMFPKVKEQVQRISKWEVTEATWNNGSMRYEVTSKKKSTFVVHVSCTFEGYFMVNVTCQCRMMESEDIPCDHIFCVMKYAQLEKIPPCCISNRWTKDAKKAFTTEVGTNALVWTEQINRYHALRNKGNVALFKASKSVDETERVDRFFDDIMSKHHESPDPMPHGPVPAHFSRANRPYATFGVLDPKKKISKGAPSINKRWKAYLESWKIN